MVWIQEISLSPLGDFWCPCSFSYIYIYVYVFLRMFLFKNPSWWSWDFIKRGGGGNSGYPKMTTSIGCTASMAWFKHQFQLGEYPMLQPGPLVLENLHMKVTVVSLWCSFLLHYFFRVHVRNMRYSTDTTNRNVYISGIQNTRSFLAPQKRSGDWKRGRQAVRRQEKPRWRTCCYPSTRL